jgi:hypothetical protein
LSTRVTETFVGDVIVTPLGLTVFKPVAASGTAPPPTTADPADVATAPAEVLATPFNAALNALPGLPITVESG